MAMVSGKDGNVGLSGVSNARISQIQEYGHFDTEIVCHCEESLQADSFLILCKEIQRISSPQSSFQAPPFSLPSFISFTPPLLFQTKASAKPQNLTINPK